MFLLSSVNPYCNQFEVNYISGKHLIMTTAIAPLRHITAIAVYVHLGASLSASKAPTKCLLLGQTNSDVKAHYL